jgi:hypothetical protein
MTSSANVEVFAHIAPQMRFDGRTLTLVDISPSTIWMPGPHQSSGRTPELDYLPTGALLDRWTDRARAVGAARCRIRGTLALLDPDAQIAGRTVLELRSPRLTADGLAYDVEILTGIMPSSSGACVLFLDWSDVSQPDESPSGATDQHSNCYPRPPSGR